jgi:hypothetical protein
VEDLSKLVITNQKSLLPSLSPLLRQLLPLLLVIHLIFLFLKNFDSSI